jgi:hypothetical protein
MKRSLMFLLVVAEKSIGITRIKNGSVVLAVVQDPFVILI